MKYIWPIRYDRGNHPQNQSIFMFPIGMQGRIKDFPEGAPTYYLAKFSRKLHDRTC